MAEKRSYKPDRNINNFPFLSKDDRFLLVSTSSAVTCFSSTYYFNDSVVDLKQYNILGTFFDIYAENGNQIEDTKSKLEEMLECSLEEIKGHG